MQRDVTALVKAVAGVVREHVTKAVSVLSSRMDDIEKRLAELPEPRDGATGEKGEKGEPGLDGKDGKDGKDGRDGVDGKSVTIEEVTPILREWFDAIPRPKDGNDGKDGRDGTDGKSVTIEDVQPILENAVTKWALDFERRAQDVLQRAIDRMPTPKDGRDGINGKDGRDAFQLEDVELAVADDERTLKFAFVRDDTRVERSIRLNHPIYRGIWKEGAYEKGDCVTFGGSAFIATRETKSKPETDDSWKLCVKRGRDGRDGQKGDPGPQGPRGPKGETPAELQTGKIR